MINPKSIAEIARVTPKPGACVRLGKGITVAVVVGDSVGGCVFTTVLTVVRGVIMVVAGVVICVVTCVGVHVFVAGIVVADEISGFTPWLRSDDFLLIVFPSIL